MKSIHEVRIFKGSEEVRELCIKRKWYTMGSTKDYENMLSQCYAIASYSALKNIANDILEHSDIEYENYGYECKYEYLASIMTDLVKYCTVTYFEFY